MSEIEDENDALNLQIAKMTSSGKPGKYMKHKKPPGTERKSESSDDEDFGELRLQLDIMDNEMKACLFYTVIIIICKLVLG